jgi:predicted phage tail protein
VAVHNAAIVSILLGDGTGSFAARTDIATSGTFPWSASIANLDGDPRPDLIVANNDVHTVSVFLNTTDTVSTAPDAPTIIRNATAGHGTATVSWTAPVWDGGSPLTGYVVTPYVGYSPRPSTTFSSTSTTQTVTGLTDGTEYRFRVQAINAVGTSSFSTVTNPVIPGLTVPGAPTIIRNATAGDGTATVSWIAPASDGGSTITGYVVTPYVGYSPRPPTTFLSTATTQTVTGLINGTTYRFRVQAMNAIGTGGYSTVTNPVIPTL